MPIDNSLSGSYLLLVSIMLLVIFAAYLTTRYIAGKGRGFTKGKYMKIRENLVVGKDKSILLLEAGEKLYIVGITNQNMRLLSEFSKSELPEVVSGEESGQAGVSLQSAMTRMMTGFRGLKNAPQELREKKEKQKQAKRGKGAEPVFEEVWEQAEADTVELPPPFQPFTQTEPTVADAESVDAALKQPGGEAPAWEGGTNLHLVEKKHTQKKKQQPAPADKPEKQVPQKGSPVQQAPRKGSFAQVMQQANELASDGDPEVILELSRSAASPKQKRNARGAAPKPKLDEIDKMMLSIEQRTKELKNKHSKDEPKHER